MKFNSIRALLVGLLWCSGAVAAEFRGGIEFAHVGPVPLRLDAGMPEGPGPYPIGDDTIFTNTLTGASFVWFSVDYRLAPSNVWPACIEDVESAIRWVKAHGAEFKGDTNRIALIGYSAGGHLACHAAVLGDDATRVQAVVGCAAPTDHIADSERRGGLSKSLQALLARPPELDGATRMTLREMSPINHVKPGLPPFLLIHGTADQSVPYAQSVEFAARLRRAGVPCELITVTNAPHRIRDWQHAAPQFQQRMVDWLRQALPTARPQAGDGAF
jgi:alpha-L-fucosidase 2